MYSLSFPGIEEFSITAEPGQVSFLEIMAGYFGLKARSTGYPGKIIIKPLGTREEIISAESSGFFYTEYGSIALKCPERTIEVGVPENFAGSPETISGIIKLIIVGISSYLLYKGCVLMHTATLIHSGEAVLVVASSGGGKSTTAGRVPEHWSAPGDENCLIVPAKSGGYRIQVLPTVSKIAKGEKNIYWDSLVSYHLKGICILKQADDDAIERISQPKASMCIHDSFRQATNPYIYMFDANFRRNISEIAFDNSCRIAKEVPVYLLNATLSGRFWEVIEDKMF